MALKLLSGYAGPNFTDPAHPGYGHNYLILNAGDHNGQFDFDCVITGLSHRVSFCVPWEGLAAFYQYVLRGTSVGVPPLVRTLPMLSPFAAIFPNTYAARVSGKGSGSDAAVTDVRPFADCVLSVQFETLTYALEGAGAFLEVNYGGSADYDTVPDAHLQFSGGEKIDHDAGVLVGQVSLQISVHNVPDPGAFLSAVSPLKGKVNSAALAVDGFTYPAGSILFPTFDLQKTVSIFGSPTAEATVQLLQRDIGWNQGITSRGAIEDVIITGTSVQPYQTADLSPLLSL